MADYLIAIQIGLIIDFHSLLKEKIMNTSYVSIVINPSAGNGKAKRIAQSLLQKIKSASDFEISINFTRGKNDATLITREAIMDGASMIIAVGGDGTINEVVNGFFLEGEPLNPLCELGIINCGTGGGFARTLNIPNSTVQQIEQLLKPGSIALDLGHIKCKDYSGATVSRLFVNECQIGIGSEVAAIVGKKSKFFGGTIAFGCVATFLAMFMKPLNLSIEFDNEDFQEFRLIGLVIGNGTECAGGMKLTPDAKLNDGFFDVLSINDMKTGQRILNLSKVYSGTHILSPHCSVKRCKKLKVRSASDVSLESDGEIFGNSPFDIEILPAAIMVKAGNINN
jgi:YegS/Rv2252/BmrU family lipid kinase